MEKLETLPYRKLTTREISLIINEESLIRSLRSVDKAIYAKAGIEEVKQELEQLRGYSERKFEEKLEEIKHGISDKQ